MRTKPAIKLRAGDKLRCQHIGDVITLTYAGRGLTRGAVLIRWSEDGEDKGVHVSPHHEFEVV